MNIGVPQAALNGALPTGGEPGPLRAWPVASRIALREIRGGLGALRLMFVCLLLGVLALAGVGTLASSIQKGLSAQGQELLGGDIEARLTQRFPGADEAAALRALGDVSESVRMRAMARGQSGAAAGKQLLVELKAVDSRWPLYGTAQLAGQPAGNASVQQALARGAVIGEALADQLGLRVGDRVAIGDASLMVTGIIAVEPDRAGEGFTLGPSFLVAMDRLAETALVQPGSLYRHHSRVRMPASADIPAATASLEAQFPEAGWRLADRSDGAPGVRRFVERLAQFLTLVSLTALAVAGVGVGNGVASWLDRRSGTIATLKVLGAPARVIILAYLLVASCVALVAAIIGAMVGALVPWVVVQVAGEMLPVPPQLGFHPAPMIAAIAFGLLVAIAFAIPPLARAGALPAQRIFRGAVESWPWPSRTALALSLGAGLMVAALAVWQSYERIFAIGFLIGAAAILALLLGLGTLVRRVAAALPRPRRALPRMALANLHRPGAQTRQLVVALGLGLSLFAMLAFIETSFNAALQDTIPDRAPTFFVLDLPREDEAAFRDAMPDGTDLQMVASLRGPVTAVNGTPADQITNVPSQSYVLRGDRGITFSERLPEGNRLVAGAWWPADYAGPPLVSMDAEQAGLLGLKVGDTITVSVLGVEITATIASLREIDWDSLGFNFVLVYDPNTLRDAPYTWMATVSPPVAFEPKFVGAISDQFTTVSIVRVKDVVGQVGTLLTQLGGAVRAAASVAILAGIAVLVGALAAQARTRTYENAIMKTLGATRRQLMTAAALEYAALGLIVATIALGIGALAGWITTDRVLQIGFHPNWTVAIATVAAGAIVTIALGLAGNARVLREKVASVLRQS